MTKKKREEGSSPGCAWAILSILGGILFVLMVAHRSCRRTEAREYHEYLRDQAAEGAGVLNY